MKIKFRFPVMALGSTILLLPFTHRADTTFTINNTTADAFLATGSPGNPVGADLTSLNFGGAGTPAIAPALRFLSVHFINGNFHLTGWGAAHTVYQVQTTPQLAATNWQTLATVTANNAGLIQFNDNSVPIQQHAFTDWPVELPPQKMETP